MCTSVCLLECVDVCSHTDLQKMRLGNAGKLGKMMLCGSERERETDSKTDRQPVGQAVRQTDRQADIRSVS